jgi:hypothetical protein
MCQVRGLTLKYQRHSRGWQPGNTLLSQRTQVGKTSRSFALSSRTEKALLIPVGLPAKRSPKRTQYKEIQPRQTDDVSSLLEMNLVDSTEETQAIKCLKKRKKRIKKKVRTFEESVNCKSTKTHKSSQRESPKR